MVIELLWNTVGRPVEGFINDTISFVGGLFSRNDVTEIYIPETIIAANLEPPVAEQAVLQLLLQNDC